MSSSISSTSTTRHLIPVFDAYLSNRSNRFDFLRIGHLCNGSRSFCFTEAFCDLDQIESPRLHGVPLSINMSILFDRAFEILQAQVSGKSIRLSDEEKKALTDLQNFLQNIEVHERNILSAFEKMKTEKAEKTVLCMALSEHLFSQLATGYSYCLDERAQGPNKTYQCGCDRSVHFDATGVGHHKVWHGYVDIMINENQERSAIGTVKVVTDTSLTDDGEHSGPTTSKRSRTEDGLSGPRGEHISDVTTKIRDNWDQTVAQTIVFALAHKQHHPETRRFVPSILICQNQFYIIMYEPDSDILIWSGAFLLWSSLSPSNLNKYAVITLWMVIHYKLFCSGGDIFENVHEVKAGFLDHIEEEKREYYKELVVSVDNFETEEKDFLQRGHAVSDLFENVKVKLKRQRTL